MQSTVDIFRRFVANIPPLFPTILATEIKRELKLVEAGVTDIREIEQAMVRCGYALWPWNQAFREFTRRTQESVGEQFFLSSLSLELQEKYFEYQKLGVTLQDIYSGRAAHYFNGDERDELLSALINMKQHVNEFASREVVGIKKDIYLKLVEEFQVVLEKIKNNLDELKNLAHTETQHTLLASEIRSRVEAFEHGLCLLGPDINHEEVGRSKEFFDDRRHHLSRMRGIHETIEIDFYKEEN